jgi:hypothetical protein
LLQSNNDRVAYIESFSRLSVHVLRVQIPIWKPRQAWVLQRYRWTYKILFRRSLINRPIKNYRYHERILYVIQLSDMVYNVTFPAYDLYSLANQKWTIQRNWQHRLHKTKKTWNINTQHDMHWTP